MSNQKNKYSIPILKRSLAVIELINSAENGLSSGELENLISIPRSSMFRILNTLVEAKWLQKQYNRYLPGSRMIQSGMLALSRIELRRVAIPFMNELTRETSETSHMGILSGTDILIVEVCDGPKHIYIASRPGLLLHPHCSSIGKVILAFCVDDIEAFFKGKVLEKRTPAAITDYDALRQELETVRKKGYGFDNTEYYKDVRCLAAPICDRHGIDVGAIGITATSLSFKKEMETDMAVIVKRYADKISSAIGMTKEP